MAEPPVADHVENCINLHTVNAHTTINVPGVYKAIVEIRFEMRRQNRHDSYARGNKAFVFSSSKHSAPAEELGPHVDKSSKHSDIVSQIDASKPQTGHWHYTDDSQVRSKPQTFVAGRLS